MRPSNHWSPSPQAHSMPARTGLVKTSDDYKRAIGRGWWLILLVTLLGGGIGTVLTLKQQPVYLAVSRVLIEPPRAIVPDLVADKSANAASLNFFNTRVQMIGSREITHRVITAMARDQSKTGGAVADPFETLLDWVEVKPVLNSNLVDVMVQGTDAQVAAKIVNHVVDEFMQLEETSLREFEQLSRSKIDSELRNLKNELDNKSKALKDFHREHKNYLQTGESVEATRLAELEHLKTEAELRADESRRAVEMFEALRDADVPFFSEDSESNSALIRTRLREIDAELAAQRESIKPEWYDSDPMIRRLENRRKELAASLNTVGAGDAEEHLIRLKQEAQLYQMDLTKIREQVEAQRKVVIDQQEEKERLDQLRMDNERLMELTDKMTVNEIQVDMHQSLITPRIQVVDRADIPSEPIRPIKEIQIPVCFAGSMLLGFLLVTGLEFMNQRVRRAEQASACLGLPVLAAVPKLSRRERLQWGGTIRFASEQPGSKVCENFRNLRTGLLGAEGHEPIRSLVVSSPTPGEGTTTISLNLGATCARAGERVLVVDLDFRHPRLARTLGLNVRGPGLIDVITGAVPWTEVAQETAVPNLFALTAGDTAGIPTDVLGTVEMHDLLAELADEFDRVILDGPPLLGLADTRVVSRFADATLLVVQAAIHRGSHLMRVRELCDREGLRPIGAVLNKIHYRPDDFHRFKAPARRGRTADVTINTPVARPEPVAEAEAQVA